MKNFYRYLDREGKGPFHTRTRMKAKSHPYYVRYVNDKPVAYHGPLEIVATLSPVDNKLKFYDYSQEEFILANKVKAE